MEEKSLEKRIDDLEESFLVLSGLYVELRNYLTNLEEKIKGIGAQTSPKFSKEEIKKEIIEELKATQTKFVKIDESLVEKIVEQKVRKIENSLLRIRNVEEKITELSSLLSTLLEKIESLEKSVIKPSGIKRIEDEKIKMEINELKQSINLIKSILKEQSVKISLLEERLSKSEKEIIVPKIIE